MKNAKPIAIKEALNILVPDLENIIKNAQRYGSKIEYSKFLEVISRESYNLAKELGTSDTSVIRFLRKVFPNKPANIKICTYILSEFNLKYCPSCREVLEYTEFFSNSGKSDNHSTQCRACSTSVRNEYQREYQARRRALKITQTPLWADLEIIKEIYNNCPKGYEVDHIIPLKGELVCGLHIAENLQYLTAHDNASKGNRYIE